MACYNYAHKRNQGTTEIHAGKLSTFIKEVAEPWKKIRNDMSDIKEKVGEYLLSLFESCVQCAHTEGIYACVCVLCCVVCVCCVLCCVCVCVWVGTA